MHVLADALTSIFAIFGLLLAKYYNILFIDSIMGIVGGIVITKWAFNLIKKTSPILLDAQSTEVKQKIIDIIENEEDKITDLHVWNVTNTKLSVIIAICSSNLRPLKYYKNKITKLKNISHVTVEVHGD